jgi:hypothetical protein
MLTVMGMSYLMYDEDEELFADVIDTYADMQYKCLETILQSGVKVDFAHYWEDICFKNGPLLSPTLFRELCEKHYKKRNDLCHRYGIDIISLDCDGVVDALLPVWLDSGVNALSFVKCLLPFRTHRVLSVKTETCKASGLPLFVQAELLIDGVRVTITVDWRKQRNPKQSRLLVGDRSIAVDHMARTLADGDAVAQYATGERLLEHYLNFFKNAEIAGAGEAALRIHQILFEVVEVYEKAAR